MGNNIGWFSIDIVLTHVFLENYNCLWKTILVAAKLCLFLHMNKFVGKHTEINSLSC